MTRLAYFDLANGISGDMALAALVAAGRRLGTAVESAVTDAIASLPLECAVAFVDDERGGLACLRAEVKTDDTRHPARALRDAIERAAVTDRARGRALAAIDALVGAEARVHGVAPEDVHFHELASADTVVDLLGAAVALDVLDVARVCAAPVPVPSGWVTAGHGELPLPAPVVLELLRGARLVGIDATSELVTPSGAAILVAHETEFGPLPEILLEATGVGGGSRISERPNISRVLIGSATRPSSARVEACVLLEANIDDQTPESIGHAIQRLIERGALDAWVTPIVMKKSRPAFALSVLVRPDSEAALVRETFLHTTTIGLRRRILERHALDREELIVDLDGEPVRVKVARLGAEVVNVAPEFDDCARIARLRSQSLDDVLSRATALAKNAVPRLANTRLGEDRDA